MQNGRPKPKNEPAGAETQKIREMGIFRSPKFRITCIIRNSYNQKKKLPFSLSVRFPAASVDAFQFAYACIYTAGRITSMFKRSTYACGGCSGALPVMLYKQYRFFCFGDTMLILPTAVLCQSMHRWLHNKCVPQSCSPPRCQSAPHPRCSLQSTALPTLPDNPHPPAA